MSRLTITIDGVAHELEVERDARSIRSGDQSLEIVEVADGAMRVRHGGRQLSIPFSIDGSVISFAFDGEIYVADVAESAIRPRIRHRDQSTSAPMPGQVRKVLVSVGDEVTKGTGLLILEAMKMEHTIIAPRDGRVKSVNCREGELVQPGVELVEWQDE